MSRQTLVVIIFVILYLVLNRWVLPRLGVQT
jgi:F0F1-type ATP synthase membrane subunit b/b'